MKQVMCLLARKRVYVIRLMRVVSEIELIPPGSLNHLHGEFLPDFL